MFKERVNQLKEYMKKYWFELENYANNNFYDASQLSLMCENIYKHFFKNLSSSIEELCSIEQREYQPVIDGVDCQKIQEPFKLTPLFNNNFKIKGAEARLIGFKYRD